MTTTQAEPALAEVPVVDDHTDSVLAACELVDRLNEQISELYDRLDDLFSRRQIPIAYIDKALCAGMRSEGQRTLTIGRFKLTTGIESQRECAAHGALIESCDCTGDIHIVRVGHRPFVRVARKS